jgi:protoporphyrinogen oxidase
MRDVVIIGGGLSGLSAAYELEQLKVPYRLIEVKKRLGGSLTSVRVDNFTVDNGAFAFPSQDDFTFLDELGLGNTLYKVNGGQDRATTDAPQAARLNRQWVAFPAGTQTLIDALSSKLNGTIMNKMAVSSLGKANTKYTICLENGLMLNTNAIIVAAPARYAERMFRTLRKPLSQHLFEYTYDTITRVSLGYRREDIDLPPSLPWDMAVAFYWWTDHPDRVPPGHILLHVGLRTDARLAASESLIGAVHEQLKAVHEPVMGHVSHWAEADPLPPHMSDFREKVSHIRNMVPAGMALVGSDYNGLSLSARFNAGRAAARNIADWLNK